MTAFLLGNRNDLNLFEKQKKGPSACIVMALSALVHIWSATALHVHF